MLSSLRGMAPGGMELSSHRNEHIVLWGTFIDSDKPASRSELSLDCCRGVKLWLRANLRTIDYEVEIGVLKIAIARGQLGAQFIIY